MVQTLFILIIICFCNKILRAGGDQNLAEHGRTQYQLLKEKGNLPNYGTCWKQGVEHLEEGCRYLSENTQSEIALHLTNCFLIMSGHDTYNCDSDKKPNLRAICINNMSDRAFNVYTEFYTHIQNICGFLQGQIWQEIIAENTVTVGRRLKETVQNQEGLLEAQKESLKLQAKMLQHGQVLENILDNLFLSFKTHQDVLNILSDTVSNLRNWIIGELSWFDSVLFYTVSVILVFIFTSSQKTGGARLLILFSLLLNFLLERLICSIYIFISNEDTTNMHSSVYNYIWFSRYTFMLITVVLLIYFAFNQSDPLRKQYEMLCSIQEQNSAILSILKSSNSCDKSYLNNINEVIKNVNESSFSKNDKNFSNHSHREYVSVLNQSMPECNITPLLETNKQSNSSSSKVRKKNYTTNNGIDITDGIKSYNEDKYNLRSNSRCSSREPPII